MTEKSIDQTLLKIREIPESVEYEDVVKMVIAMPIAATTSFGFAKLFLKFLHFKFIIPMIFTTTSAGLAVWYAFQTFSPGSPNDSNSLKARPEPKPVIVQMNKDLPMILASIPADTQKKRQIKKQEVKIIRKGNPGDLVPTETLPPLPPLAPLPPGAKGKQVIEKQERIIQHTSEDESAEKGNDPMFDPFVSALLDYLIKEGLLKNRDNFTIDFSPSELEVNSVSASKEQLKKAIQIFEEKEGEKFGKGSEIEIRHKKGKWSISKSIEN